jgi:molybdate transport system ATP-binding protein
MKTDETKTSTLVELCEATLRIRDRPALSGVSWRIRTGEHWAVLGLNGAGKSTLVRALTGEVPVIRGVIHPAEPLRLRRQSALVSFERQRGLIARDEQGDRARYFSGEAGGGIRVREVFTPSLRWPAGRGPGPADGWGLAPLLNRRVRDLSGGEMRKLQIVLALSAAPRLLILDEPFEGLDAGSREALAALIERLMDDQRSVVLVTHRRSEIPPGITHVLGLKEGRVLSQGPRRDVLTRELLDALYAAPTDAADGPGQTLPPPPPLRPESGALIEIRDLHVRYGGCVLFDGLDWTVRSGEHWAVSGPNGSGKTTLLRLIIGDHPQAYSNWVKVFGRRRGPGSGIRELKARLGFVSPTLQVSYRKNVTALEAVVSGFFDSIGLYRRPAPQQTESALCWMQRLGVHRLAGRPFNHLSQGEQRMLLLARAMVRSPRLLVLDEPCQGLDPVNRRMIRETVDALAGVGSTTVVYVSHRADEIPARITHRLMLERFADGPARAVVEMV